MRKSVPSRRRRGEPVVASGLPNDGAARAAGRRVLIIDRDPGAGAAVAAVLAGAGLSAECRRVCRPEEFLRGLREFAPDVILSEYGTPEFNALHVLRLVRGEGAAVPFLLVTDEIPEEVVFNCIKEGAEGYLLKSSLDRLPSVLGAVRNGRPVPTAHEARGLREEPTSLDGADSRLRFLLDQLPGILWTTDAELRLTSTLGAGLAPINSRANQLAGTRISDLFPGNPEPEAVHRRALAGEPGRYETRYKDRVMRCHVDPLVDPSSRVVGTVGVAVDITERMGAERREGARLAVTRALAESTTLEEAAGPVLKGLGGLGWDAGVLWVVDPEVRVLRCIETWHGGEAAEPEFVSLLRRIVVPYGQGLAGKAWASGEPSWVPDLAREGAAGLAAAAGFRSACLLPLRAGGRVQGVVELLGREVRPADPTMLEAAAEATVHVGHFLERNQAVEALARSERALAEAQKIAGIGSWDWSVAGNHVVWSDELYRMFGLDPQSFGATYESYLERVHPEDRERVERVLARAITERRPFAYDCRIIRADGQVRIVHARGETILDPAGQPVRLAGTCQDVTQERERRRKKLHLAVGGGS
jgi:PAS domain S-box-containing protein